MDDYFEKVGTCRKYIRRCRGHAERWAFWITADCPRADPIAQGIRGSEALASQAADEAIKKHGLANE